MRITILNKRRIAQISMVALILLAPLLCGLSVTGISDICMQARLLTLHRDLPVRD